MQPTQRAAPVSNLMAKPTVDLDAPPFSEYRLPFQARSTLINRNIMVAGRRTSVRLEPEMWTALLDIARRENQTIHALATQVAERKKPETSLTAAIRVFCLGYYRLALDFVHQQKSPA